VTRYRIEVDHNACQGTGMCAGIAPDHFELGSDYLARPMLPVVDADAVVVDAAECCPMEAITLVDADSGEPVG
jgi:ferredoxin